MRDGTSELHVAALHALLETAAGAVDAFAERYSQRVAWLRTFLSHVDDEGAIPSSKLCYGHRLPLISLCMVAKTAVLSKHLSKTEFTAVHAAANSLIRSANSHTGHGMPAEQSVILFGS